MPLSMPHIFIPDTSLITDPTLALTMMARAWALRTRRATSTATAPTYVAAGAVASSGTVSYYAGISADDIGIIVARGYNIESYSATGWTHIATASSSVTSGVLWRRMTGGESGTVAVSPPGGGSVDTAVMIGIRGCIASGTPYEGYNNTGGGPGETAQTSATIVTTAANRLGVRMGVWAGGLTATSPPSTWTERVDGASSECAVQIDTKDIPTSGTEAASTRTLSAGYWDVHTLAMLPSA